LEFDSIFLTGESPLDKKNSIWERKVQNQMFMDSIKFYLRFNWIYGGFDCKKNWFLSQFRLLLEEIKVMGFNYNFKELIWSSQGLNYIIIEVWWPFRDLIETIQSQGPNQKKVLNSRDLITIFLRAWLQNCINIQGPNRKYHLKWKNGVVSFKTIHCLLQIKRLAIKTRETLTAETAELQSRGGASRGRCSSPPWCTPAVTKKRLRPLAIKARGRTEPRRGGRNTERGRV